MAGQVLGERLASILDSYGTLSLCFLRELAVPQTIFESANRLQSQLARVRQQRGLSLLCRYKPFTGLLQRSSSFVYVDAINQFSEAINREPVRHRYLALRKHCSFPCWALSLHASRLKNA